MINRHNYETFFLMYIDKELSIAEQKAVEAFLLENADLQPEFDALQAVTLLPEETLFFANKSTLLKNTTQFADADDIEEKLLLYIDNELPRTSKLAVEGWVAQKPSLQAALALLQQTKLPVATICHPNKEELYRKEERRAVVLWMRMGIAAALAGLVAMVWVTFSNNNIIEKTAAIAPTKKSTKSNAFSIAEQSKVEKELAKNTPAKQVMLTSLNSKQLVAFSKHQTAVKTNLPKANSLPTISNSNMVSTNTFSNSAIAANKNINANPNVLEQNQVAQLQTASHSSTAALVSDAFEPKQSTQVTANVAPETVATVYRELDTHNDNKSLYVGALELNKDNLRGVARKLTSFFNRKAKREEEKLKQAMAFN